ncbi:MAG: DUF1761 domain-containing protein [Minisyncoccia bacterium]
MLPISFTAVLAAAVTAFIIGAVWHTVLFTKLWLQLAGLPEPTEEEKKAYAPHMWKPLLAGFTTHLIMAFCLANILFVNTAYFNNAGSALAGILAGFWTWLGFMATNTLTPVIWERRSIKYWAFGNAYTLTIMLTMGVIISLIQ